MIEYGNLRDRDELVARARDAKEHVEASTVDDRDDLLHDLLSRAWPTLGVQSS
jgi:hypothetical protein